MTEREQSLRARGFKQIAGVDEAGRGPLAGPVVAAACIIQEGVLFAGLNDSKLLKPEARSQLYQTLVSHEAVHYGIGIVEHVVIDEINILQATLLAMKQAVEALPVKPDYVLIDGTALPSLDVPLENIIDGDACVYGICAASVIAKETRDAIMRQYHLEFPQYGFDAHKGYGTPQHKQALKSYGPCRIHRKSFAPVREII